MSTRAKARSSVTFVRRVLLLTIVSLFCSALSAWVPAFLVDLESGTIVVAEVRRGSTWWRVTRSDTIASTSITSSSMEHQDFLDSYRPSPRKPLEILPDWAAHSPPEVHAGTMIAAYGWPYLALKYRWEWQNKTSYDVKWGIFYGKYRVGKGRRVIPLEPIWGGFLTNALVYALVLAALWITKLARPFTLLRRYRIRQGRCPACGHRVLERARVCPECGTALREEEDLCRAG